MISPTPRAIGLFLAGLLVALIPTLWDTRLWLAWPIFFGLCVALIVWDLLWLVSEGPVVVDARLPREMFMGSRAEAEISVRVNGLRRHRSAEALLELDDDLRSDEPRGVLLEALAETRFEVSIVPIRRGELEVRAVWLRWPGPLGLLRRQVRSLLARQITVVPDTTGVRELGPLFQGDRRDVSGLKVERFTGEGSEFEALREFVPGLDARTIDWKASARHRSLLVRQHRAERDHSVLIAIDTGLQMAEHLSGQPRLDHAIRAALSLAYVCLKTGDRVGLGGFDERLHSYLEPRRGISAFARLRKRSAHLDYGTTETNYLHSMTQLATKLPRRTLVVVFTDFVDSITAEILVDRLEQLARRHLVLFVAIQDPRPAEMASRRPDSLLALDRAVLAADLVRDREAVLLRLRRSGVHCLDALPHQASPRLVQRYLDIKRRELL